MKKNKTAKVFAILALIGIVASIVWVGALSFFSPSQQPELSEEELQQIIEKSQKELWLDENTIKVEASPVITGEEVTVDWVQEVIGDSIENEIAQ